MQYHYAKTRFVLILLLVGGLVYIFSARKILPPKQLDNICVVMKLRPAWYRAAQKAQEKWGVSVSTQMAFIYRESHFRSEAMPMRKKLFGFIPWFRSSSAKGYAQAVNNTWRVYLRETHQRGALRNNFAKSLDFVGWYLHRAHHRLGISKNNVYALYLAYHEGLAGYARGHYQQQPQLMQIAHKVQRRALRYQQQLIQCKKQLPKKAW